jgi:hypothetical protein
MRDIIAELEAKIREDLVNIDVDESYDQMLDECYDLSTVGGPFSHMLASRVLRECDPIAYRCGISDYTDSLEAVEVSGDYYNQREAECAKDALVDELQDEIDDLQSQLDDLDPSEEENIEECDSLGSEINELEELITKLRKYSF